MPQVQCSRACMHACVLHGRQQRSELSNASVGAEWKFRMPGRRALSLLLVPEPGQAANLPLVTGCHTLPQVAFCRHALTLHLWAPGFHFMPAHCILELRMTIFRLYFSGWEIVSSCFSVCFPRSGMLTLDSYVWALSLKL